MFRWSVEKVGALLVALSLVLGGYLSVTGGPALADDESSEKVTTQKNEGANGGALDKKSGYTREGGERGQREGRAPNPLKGAGKALGTLTAVVAAAAALKWPLRLAGWRGYRPLWHKIAGGIAVAVAVGHGATLVVAEGGRWELTAILGAVAGGLALIGGVVGMMIGKNPSQYRSLRQAHIATFVAVAVMVAAHLAVGD